MDHQHSFDDRAATWDEQPGNVQRAIAVADRIAAAIALGPTVRLFEYGAGTGLVSQALRDRVGPITLADASEGMRAVVRSKVHEGVLPGARVWDVDLATEPPPVGEQFELVVTAMTLHHIADLGPVLGGFRQLLAPGGHLCIVDLDEEDGSFHGEGFGGHHGFARPVLERQLIDAGFRDVAFADCYRMEREGGTFQLFLATCRA